jgi:hypothetical protein
VVDVGGKQWQASVESDCLRLTTTIQTDDGKDQTASRIADIKREVEARQQEMEDLSADCARVMEEAGAVCNLCFLFVSLFSVVGMYLCFLLLVQQCFSHCVVHMRCV